MLFIGYREMGNNEALHPSNKSFIISMKKSNDNLLSRNIATIAVFYALPVIQLVITYQTVRAIDCFSCQFCDKTSTRGCAPWMDVKPTLCTSGCQCHREPGHLLLQLPVCPPPGSS